MPTVGRRRLVLAVVVVVALAAGLLVWRPWSGGEETVAGATVGWGPRWPLRGALAADTDALEGALLELGRSERAHLVWAGRTTKGPSGEEVDAVLVAVEDGPGPAALRTVERRQGRWRTSARTDDRIDPEADVASVTALPGPDGRSTLLVAADARLVRVLASGPRGRVEDVPEPVDGLARSTLFPGRSVVLTTRANELRHQVPWLSAPLDLDALDARVLGADERTLVSLAGATVGGEGVGFRPDGQLDAGEGAGTYSVTEVRAERRAVTTPDGREGSVVRLFLVRPADPGRRLVTLAFVPADRRAAVIAEPVPVDAVPAKDSERRNLAVAVRGLARTDLLLVAGNRLTVVPAVPRAGGRGVAFFGPFTRPVSVLFAGSEGDVYESQVVRPPAPRDRAGG